MEQPPRIGSFTLRDSVQYERQAPLNDQARPLSGESLRLNDGRQRPADLLSRKRIALTSGDGSRTIVHAIACEGGGSAA